MIQILGLREFYPKKDDGTLSATPKLYDAFFDKNWRAKDIFDLFENLEKYVDMIPVDERWNMFYTVANCTDEKRLFAYQDVLPIDIDGITEGTEAQVVSTVCKELGIDESKVGIIYSGNGVHILIGLANKIENASYIRVNKVYYKALSGRINTSLYMAGLKGSSDTTVFSEARILRLPFTKNRKKDKAEKDCRVINRNIERLDVSLMSLSQIPEVGEGEHIHPNAFRRMTTPDREAIEKGCGFIEYCRTNQEKVSEPQWYAMLSIVGRYENGEKAVIEYSKNYSLYDETSTITKMKHALEASGPRTCANISTLYEGCKTCPHFNKITSPIQLVGESTIKTKDSGFYNIVFGKDGEVKLGKPNYDDLEKWFRKGTTYVTNNASETSYKYNGAYWEELQKLEVYKFAEDNFRPSPTNNMCAEFYGKIKRLNNVPNEFFSTSGLLNFTNGVYDIETKILTPHKPEQGFTYVIPYDFAPKGDCPTFKKFLREVCCADVGLQSLLEEYLGFCISGIHPKFVQKCALLYGDGSNGKSVVIDILRELVGKNNWTAMNMKALSKDNYRYQLMYKMFNVSEETPSDAFLDSSIFKDLVAGGTVPVRKLYGDPIDWECDVKMMFACNDLPSSGDFSYGMQRRLLIIPFRNTFSDKIGNRDPMILEKLKEERSDILVYLLQAVKRLEKRGFKFEDVKACREELEDYKASNDYVGIFVEHMCAFVEDESKTVGFDLAYKCFVAWCKEMSIRPTPLATFTRRFSKHVTKMGVTKARVSEGGTRMMGYQNLVIEHVASKF